VSNFKPNYFQRRSKPQGPKANERIRALDVQVIGSDGNNLGSMPINKAIELAKQEGLDLIEISPNANPPVCKIMDMGKYKYDLQKKANQAKKKHDYNFKIKNAKKFIIKGDKVKFTVKFKGREMQHTELGKNLMNRIIEETKDIAKVESQPKFEGRQMVMIIQPI
jgi:translation initiation factor IF-3